MVNPNHITPYFEIGEDERKLADDLVFNRREDALEIFIAHFESADARRPRTRRPTRPRAWSPRRRCTSTSCAARRRASRTGSTGRVEKIGAVPTLNEVLLPAMKEVGDKFGAGELILPFVLQSATVMKRAVAQLENYLDKVEGYTKGTVVLATVFGDVHDIGKSLVNTILTNNGYTVVDLGKQVPISTILEAAQERNATAIGLSALLVSTSKQMPLCIEELHEKGLEFPVLIGGAAINRDFGLRALYPKGKASDEIYEPGVFYCKDAFEGLHKMDQLIEDEGRAQLVTKVREAALHFRLHGKDPPPLITDDDSVRSAARTDVPIPEPPFWGAREIDVPLDEIFPHLDTHVLFKLHWGGRGVKGEAWRKLIDEDFQPRLERMWREQDYLHPRARLGYFPCYSEGNEVVVLDPDDRETVLERLVFPRQPGHHRICLADFFRPKDSGELDVVALQAVTVGPRVTEVITALEQEGEFAEQLFTHGLGVQSAEGTAEWLHSRVRADLGIGATQGRRYSWGYPACPEQSEHEKIYRLLDAPVDRPDADRRLRRRARAVHARDHRPPPAGGLLRHEVGLPAEGQGARRHHRRLGSRRDPQARPRPARRPARGRAGAGRGRARLGCTPDAARTSPRPGRQCARSAQRAGHDLAELREVAVGFGMRARVDDRLRREKLAGVQVERVRERDDAGVAQQHRAMRRLDLLRQALEAHGERDRTGRLVDDRRVARRLPGHRQDDRVAAEGVRDRRANRGRVFEGPVGKQREVVGGREVDVDGDAADLVGEALADVVVEALDRLRGEGVVGAIANTATIAVARARRSDRGTVVRLSMVRPFGEVRMTTNVRPARAHR